MLGQFGMAKRAGQSTHDAPLGAGLSLRLSLRTETSAAHERLDALVSTFDLRTPSGLAAFLSMQASALGAISGGPGSAPTLEMAADLAARARADLALLEQAGRLTIPSLPRDLDPLAVDYIVSGSRLGTMVLKRRWEASTDRQVRAARNYFTAPSYIETWKSFCAEAESDAFDPARKRKIVNDTNVLFDFYAGCASSTKKLEGMGHG